MMIVYFYNNTKRVGAARFLIALIYVLKHHLIVLRSLLYKNH